eukprot:sb/3472669/
MIVSLCNDPIYPTRSLKERNAGVINGGSTTEQPVLAAAVDPYKLKKTVADNNEKIETPKRLRDRILCHDIVRGNNTEYRLEWEKICDKLISSLTCPNGSPLALLSFSKLGMRCNMFISGSRDKIKGTKVISGLAFVGVGAGINVLALVGVGAGIKSLSHLVN